MSTFGLLVITARRQVTPGQLRLANAYYACMQHEHPAMNPPRLHCILFHLTLPVNGKAMLPYASGAVA